MNVGKPATPLSEDDEDVQKILDIAAKAVNLVPDIENLEAKLGKLKPGEKDEFLDKIINEIRNHGKVSKHWETASSKTVSGPKETLDKLQGVLKESLKGIPAEAKTKAKLIKKATKAKIKKIKKQAKKAAKKETDPAKKKEIKEEAKKKIVAAKAKGKAKAAAVKAQAAKAAPAAPAVPPELAGL